METKENISSHHIVLIGTGGTIAGIAPNTKLANQYQAGSISIETLTSSIQNQASYARNLSDDINIELNKVKISDENLSTLIVTEQLFNIDSKDMTISHWQTLTQCVSRHLNCENVKGVLITHGTDTLEETAYWLHLTVASSKPIVMTAAMRPSNVLSADGPRNLQDGLAVARSAEASGRGVLITFGGKIFSARDIIKVSTYANDAFSSGENGLIGWVNSDLVEFSRSPITRHSINSEFASNSQFFSKLSNLRVEIVFCYPGMSSTLIDLLVDQKVKGIVLAGVGNGSIPESIIAALYRANEAGVILIISSRVRPAKIINDGKNMQPVIPASIATQVKKPLVCLISSNDIDIFKARILLLLALSKNINTTEKLQQIFNEY